MRSACTTAYVACTSPTKPPRQRGNGPTPHQLRKRLHTSVAVQQRGVAAVALQTLFVHHEHGDLRAVCAAVELLWAQCASKNEDGAG